MASSNQKFCEKKSSFLVITGASRGLGRAVAKCFTERLGCGSHVLLLARNEEGLAQTKAEIEIPEGVAVHCTPVDLQTADEVNLTTILNDLFTAHEIKASGFDQLIVVHNAGSLGDVSKLANEFRTKCDIQSYWSLNLTSCILLNSLILDKFPSTLNCSRFIVNISSIAVMQPFKSWSLYCTGKAARDMFFRVLAAEHSNIQVLSYAPGPLDTDMLNYGRSESADADLRKFMEDMNDQGKILSPMMSAKKLVKVLENNTFESGDHIDYFDVNDNGETCTST